MAGMTPHTIYSVYEAARMKRYHVISISVLIGLVLGLSVSKAANAAPLSLTCETIAPYAGKSLEVMADQDLSVGGASFEIEPIENDSTFRGSNPASTVVLSRATGGGWNILVQSRVSDRTISAHCLEVE